MKHVFIIGSRGLPAHYGGFETFVQALVSHQQSENIRYHVACLSDHTHGEHREFLGADCFTINPPKIGPARVIAYDWMAIRYALKFIQKEGIENPIFYILGNTIGAFIGPLAKKIHRVGGQLYVNPDGLEWKRSKWSKPVQLYLKYSEKVMSKKADLIVADNRGIESYFHAHYPWSRTTYVAYGTDTTPSSLKPQDTKVRDLFSRWDIQEKEYYLVVGRFVPENNYETVIREFRNTKTKRPLVLICNQEGNAYFETLRERTAFDQDDRIRFIGTVYDQDLLKYIRQEAFAYLHGHEVGGTNPGLLEALAHTDVNLVLDVEFNRQVAQDTVFYWTKEEGQLRELIQELDQKKDFQALGQKARAQIQRLYTWPSIVQQYEELFLNES
ncbi:beta 1-4 rhamnosyltransferase Cps2T [Streptococcus sp. DD13]|uniref:beta 1-4 rhamnosyltransferase Cps2T n=1 Tax=Streptococcus sp. DD13 TaxID=1777881 RepID=UPI000792E745|nr:DUF1972 domain-containing protein [Streptococcus sp. DD13]KXT79140.1 Alpha-D-GlcNAc alpha-1,2-L-rhamnosyltransferase [Streptococcus sp. DD13]